MKHKISSLSELQVSALREIVNIGVGNAVTSLSKMIETGVKIEVPDFKVELIEDVPEVLGGAANVVSGVIMHVNGDIEGYIMMMLPEEAAQTICEIITHEENTDILTPLNQSLLEEVGHILAGSYVSSLSDFLGLNIRISTPMQTFDMLGAIIDQILIEMSQKVEHALLFDTMFIIQGNRTDGFFLTMFDPDSMDTIIDRIEKMI
ncbi:MAG: chemotaxis protein CheC [Methanolobus sp.]|jgi:chemotaxis protein CheC|uniref:Chemotaxis protein CheC, inhibitor of MCP methylation n=1 Tax=Methanolobus tindarius DSM 2278 TaxID=1090322 RepID=W9DPN2_METTI|nr:MULTISPECIES: chemotaxis protein CheC [Methanolobus]ETA67233.1 chemotaxis protein CheC, inhibitor of MCP methylation [Methanolobus tindarius DSM 2278]MDK2832369.1 chemotaxis protein CheC [Methanolobus sp.]MDK2939195.1 chemotaxis protein CheC [Methanolobus sp.]